VGKIHVLDDLTANQIAAGEVIERPVSAIKELVENALDAGSRNITVEIKGGGLELIRVTDDGSGMSQEDLLLAVKRHATSKLKTITDLETLATLGFRGEALPSIVSVAKVAITSREQGEEHAYRLNIAGNEIMSIEPAGAPVGTTIVIQDIFYNTPARRKFLRSAGYEAGLVHELIIQQALGNPDVDFRLINDGKEILNTRGVNQLEDLILLFYGRDVQNALVRIEGQASQATFWGYLTLPTYHRANRRAIHFFVNSRKVLAKEIMNALENAYENTLPKGRFALAIFNISFDSSLLDVNVHPGKLEIRMRDQLFTSEFRDLIRNKINEQRRVPSYNLVPASPPTAAKPNSSARPLPIQKSGPLPTQEIWKEFYSWQPDMPKTDIVRETPLSPNELVGQAISDMKTIKREIERNESYVVNTQFLPPLRVIGQLTQTFILAEGEEGLYIIDQHVAHERVLFERLLEEVERGGLASQVLLAPRTLELTLLEEELLIQHIVPLSDLGLVIEHFGPRTYLVRAVPSVVKEDPAEFLMALIQCLEEKGNKYGPSEIRREVLVTASCKGAIKAGDKLSDEAINHLLNDLSKCVNPMTCPHGRPIIYKITHNDLLKAFRRI